MFANFRRKAFIRCGGDWNLFNERKDASITNHDISWNQPIKTKQSTQAGQRLITISCRLQWRKNIPMCQWTQQVRFTEWLERKKIYFNKCSLSYNKERMIPVPVKWSSPDRYSRDVALDVISVNVIWSCAHARVWLACLCLHDSLFARICVFIVSVCVHMICACVSLYMYIFVHIFCIYLCVYRYVYVNIVNICV